MPISLELVSPRRILVLNDHKGSAKELATQFSKAGHTIEIAHDGPGAFEAEPTFRPVIRIIDLGLLEMNACALARFLHAGAPGHGLAVGRIDAEFSFGDARSACGLVRPGWRR